MAWPSFPLTTNCLIFPAATPLITPVAELPHTHSLGAATAPDANRHLPRSAPVGPELSCEPPLGYRRDPRTSPAPTHLTTSGPRTKTTSPPTPAPARGSPLSSRSRYPRLDSILPWVLAALGRALGRFNSGSRIHHHLQPQPSINTITRTSQRREPARLCALNKRWRWELACLSSIARSIRHVYPCPSTGASRLGLFNERPKTLSGPSLRSLVAVPGPIRGYFPRQFPVM